MERWHAIYSSAVAVGGATVSFLFGGWSALLTILVTFVVLDYITGFLAAGAEGKLASEVGLRGIPKKVGIFVMVAVAHLVDAALGEQHILRDATIFFYLSNELLSIIENVGRTGLPVPDPLKQAVDVLKGKGGKND